MKRGLAASARLVLAVLLLALVPARARGEPLPPDIVVMANGDRLTGEIKSLSKGRLSLDVSATGLVSIKWDQVVAVTAGRLFEVETKGGDRLLGTLAPAGAGQVVVAGDERQSTLPLESIVSLVPIHRSFLRRLDGSINIGGSYTQSSGVAQLSLALTVTARRPSFEWRLSADDYVTFKNDGATTQRVSASIGYSRSLSRRWAAFGGGQIERNAELGFTLRSTLIGGLERTLLRTNRSDLVVGVGLGASREVPVEGSTDTLVLAGLNLRHSFFTYRTPKTSLETKLTALPILNQPRRWLIQASSSVSRELFKDFAVAVTLYESFDSRPPSADASRNDAGVTLSVSFVF